MSEVRTLCELFKWATGAPKILKGKTENEASQKCEKMENEKKTGYVLYDFMKEDLDLSGVALQVYALIYSFTKAGGDCHGSIEYICERVGASRSAVKCAIKNLLYKGYITKIADEKIKTNRYTITSPTGQNLTGQKKTPEGQKLTPDRSESDPNNKEDNKEDNNTNLLTNHSLFQGKPRPIQPFGREKVVMMTLHQYANLLRAIGVMPTRRYIAVLERQIRKFSAKAYKDHYQTIIGWARKDGLVTPEGEEILIS